MPGQITKTVQIDEIDEEMLMNLKIELDEEYGSGKEEFEIEIPDEDAEKIKTVDDAVKYIDEKG